MRVVKEEEVGKEIEEMRSDEEKNKKEKGRGGKQGKR